MKTPIVSRCLQSVMCVALALSVCCGPVSAAQKKTAVKSNPAIELGTPFADNAILQRQMAVPVWGWSKLKTKITVEFAGQKQKIKAGKDGKWMLKLKPLKTNANPQEMVISGKIHPMVPYAIRGAIWNQGYANMNEGLTYYNMMYKARKATEKAIKEGKSEPDFRTSKQYAEWAKFKGVSNRGYHYMGSAEFFVEASDAFANAMVELMKKEKHK